MAGRRGCQGIDAVDFERGRIEASALEGLHVEGMTGAAANAAVRTYVDDDGGDLQQGIRAGVEATGFHIDDHRKESPETLRTQFDIGGHQAWDLRRQASWPAARNGTSTSGPKG
jgi:hypothetical protein